MNKKQNENRYTKNVIISNSVITITITITICIQLVVVLVNHLSYV